MIWKKEFDLTSLNQGYALCRTNCVSLGIQEKNYIQAVVKDKTVQHVAIDMSLPNHFVMNCDCPRYSRTNPRYCRHMAAVLYYAEIPSEEVSEKAPEPLHRVANPFAKGGPFYAAKAPGEGYRYFRAENFTASFPFFREQIEEARAILADKRITLDSVSSGYSSYFSTDEIICTADATYSYRYGARIPMRMFLSRSRILSADCSVRGCGCSIDRYSPLREPRPLCEHLTAFLVLLNEYLASHELGDATSAAASRLFSLARPESGFLPGSDAQKPAVAANVRLEPRVHISRNYLYADFRVGTDRLYLVKDLKKLVQAAEGGELFSLGKSSAIDFSVHRISPASQTIYDFIRTCTEDERIRAEVSRTHSFSFPSQGGDVIRADISLFGDRLDRFFLIYENQTVPAVFVEKSPDHLHFVRGELKLNLSIRDISRDSDEFDGIVLDLAVPDVYRGVTEDYYIQNDQLVCISKENTRRLLPLLEAKKNDAGQLRIGRRYLSSFSRHLLPSLEPYVEVDQASSLRYQDYLPPEVRFAFYLDALENDISCQPVALYGEERYVITPEIRDARRTNGFRDLYAENDTLAYVQTLFPDFNAAEQYFRCGKDESNIYNLLENGVRHLMSIGEVHSTDQFLALKIRRKWNLSIGVSVENDLMNMTVLSEDISPEELLDILKSYRQKKKFHRLRNGDFISLENDTAETLAEIFDSLHVSPKEFVKGKMQLPAYRALYLDRMLENHEEITASRDRHFKSLIKEFKTIRDSDFEVPASLSRVMRPYQVYGFRWLSTLRSSRFGGILADDMGLGKTLQMISVLLAAKEEGSAGLSLVTCPASLIYNWLEELRRFAPRLTARAVAGTKAQRQELIQNREGVDVFVTSYDLLKRDALDYEDIVFDTHILDEAQYIKNPQSAAAKTVKVIKSIHRCALTGTPIENRLSELWSIFDFLMPGFLYGYEQFRRDFEVPITRDQDEAASEQLRRMVAPFILRRLKTDVLKDLPDKLEEIRYASFENEQRKLYDAQVVRMTSLLKETSEEEFKKNKIQTLAELTRIRQLCCDPSLLLDDYSGGSAKREALMELVREAMEGGHRMLIFSQFTTMLDLIRADLEEAGIEYYLITGSTPKEERADLVSRFNKGNTPVFLISLKAGGTGLNLTGADVVIHYDPWWNLAVQSQATDRAHRIGQTRVVSVFKLIAKGTIEEKIVELQENKKNLADEILSQEGGTLTRLSREELLELLS